MSDIYITDLDKTFLKSDLSVGEFSKEVWNDLAGRGVPLGIATARSLKKSLEFLEGLRLDIPLILLDGAMVATADKKPIRIHALDKKISAEIIDVAKCMLGIEPFIVGFEGEIVNERFLYPAKLNTFQQQLVRSYENDSRLRAKEKIEPLEKNLKIVYMGSKEEMIALERELEAVFGNSIEIKNSKDVYFECWFLTVLHPFGDKSHALEDVLEYLDASAKQLHVFGDSLNDIGMFQKAGCAVAVKNAHEETKKHADIVLERTNDEEAVAHYLSTRV